jgi:hypothetical protein
MFHYTGWLSDLFTPPQSAQVRSSSPVSRMVPPDEGPGSLFQFTRRRRARTFCLADDYPTSIRLDKSLKAYLDKCAKAQGCSMTWLIADILRKWIDWRKREEAKK